MNERILVVDDEPDVLEIVKKVLTHAGYRVECAAGGKEALDLFKENPFALVITDMRMPELDGREVLRQVKKLDETAEVIILTAYATVENANQALRDDGAFDYLTKPLERIEDLQISVSQALDRRELRRQCKKLVGELKQSRKELEKQIDLLVSLSKAMYDLGQRPDSRELARQIVRTGVEGLGADLVWSSLHKTELHFRKTRRLLSVSPGQPDRNPSSGDASQRL